MGINEGITERLNEVQGSSSISAMARQCGIGISTLYNYLKGRGVPAEMAVHICKAMHVNVGWLLTGEGAKWTDPELMREELSTLVDTLAEDKLGEAYTALSDIVAREGE